MFDDLIRHYFGKRAYGVVGILSFNAGVLSGTYPDSALATVLVLSAFFTSLLLLWLVAVSPVASACRQIFSQTDNTEEGEKKTESESR